MKPLDNRPKLSLLEQLENFVQRFKEKKPWEKQVDDTYDYHDEEGVIFHQTVRFYFPSLDRFAPDERERAREMLKPLQRFAQRRLDKETGDFRWGLKDIKPVIYNLPAVMESGDNQSRSPATCNTPVRIRDQSADQAPERGPVVQVERTAKPRLHWGEDAERPLRSGWCWH